MPTITAGTMDFDMGADLRAEMTGRIDRLLELADALPSADRRLVQAVLAHGQSITAVAQLLGEPRLRVHRRLARLLSRMNQPIFRLAIRHHDRLTLRERRLARLSIFTGTPIRPLARQLGVSLHGLRKELAGLRGKLNRLAAEG